MPCKFNRLRRVLISGLIALSVVGGVVHAASPTTPLIVPERLFAGLPRISGNASAQRILDRGSIVRLQLSDAAPNLPPDTPLIVFRQGVRLRANGQTLGVLAVPIGEARSLRRVGGTDDSDVVWARLTSVRQEISPGDSLMPQDTATQWAGSACPARSNADSDESTENKANEMPEVIALPDTLQASAVDWLVVSGGCAAGLAVDQQLTLWRPTGASYGRQLDRPIESSRRSEHSAIDDNPPISHNATPTYRIGGARVVAVYANAAIVRVRVAARPVQLGDQLFPSQQSPAGGQP